MNRSRPSPCGNQAVHRVRYEAATSRSSPSGSPGLRSEVTSTSAGMCSTPVPKPARRSSSSIRPERHGANPFNSRDVSTKSLLSALSGAASLVLQRVRIHSDESHRPNDLQFFDESRVEDARPRSHAENRVAMAATTPMSERLVPQPGVELSPLRGAAPEEHVRGHVAGIVERHDANWRTVRTHRLPLGRCGPRAGSLRSLKLMTPGSRDPPRPATRRSSIQPPPCNRSSAPRRRLGRRRAPAGRRRPRSTARAPREAAPASD